MSRKFRGSIALALLRVAACGLGFSVLADARSATVSRTGSSPCHVRVEGAIKPGDAALLARHLLPNDVLCFDSEGGSYVEGIAIARQISTTGASTLVEDGASCLSACAISFMAGRTSRFDAAPSRRMGLLAKVGFHAPFLGGGVLADRQYTRDEVQVAFDAAIASLASLLELSETIGIPDSLIAEMLRKTQSEILFIDTIDKVGRWNIQLSGRHKAVAPINRSLLSGCINAFAWSRAASSVFDHEANLSVRFDNSNLKSTSNVLSGVFRNFGEDGSSSCAVQAQINDGGIEEGRIGFALDFGAGSSPVASRAVPSWYFLDPKTRLKEHAAPLTAPELDQRK